MWLGQLVFMLMRALTAVGMSAPLITRLFGPPSNVQTQYYNLVNGPLAVAMGLLLGVAPLMRWRHQEAQAFAQVGAAVDRGRHRGHALSASSPACASRLPAAIVFSARVGAVGQRRRHRARLPRRLEARHRATSATLGVSVLLIGIIALVALRPLGAGPAAPRARSARALGYRLHVRGHAAQRRRQGPRDHRRRSPRSAASRPRPRSTGASSTRAT